MIKTFSLLLTLSIALCASGCGRMFDGKKATNQSATDFHKRTHLEQMVADQELVLEEKRVVLEKVIRASHRDIYKESDPQRTVTSVLADPKYVEAKSEYQAEQKILQSLKIRLIDERIADRSRNQ